MRGGSGTPWGLGTFLAGSAMVVAGGYPLVLGILAGGPGLVARSLRAQGGCSGDSYPAAG